MGNYKMFSKIHKGMKSFHKEVIKPVQKEMREHPSAQPYRKKKMKKKPKKKKYVIINKKAYPLG